MSYEQSNKSKHPIVTAVANKAADILHAAINPIWLKSATENISPVDLKILAEIVGILKNIQTSVDSSDEFSTVSTEDLIKKVQKMTQDIAPSSDK